jgi:hypothetical protein
MTTLEIKQKELDAKFATMLDSQHAHTHALVDIKTMFAQFLGSQKGFVKGDHLKPKLSFEQQQQQLPKEVPIHASSTPMDIFTIGSENGKFDGHSLGKLTSDCTDQTHSQ